MSLGKPKIIDDSHIKYYITDSIGEHDYVVIEFTRDNGKVVYSYAKGKTIFKTIVGDAQELHDRVEAELSNILFDEL